jgi:hypothetical protein
MKANHTHGIIAEHFTGVGTVTRDMVVERAREIAIINSRGPNHYNQDDFNQAKLELTGTTAEEEADGNLAEKLTAWDEPLTEAGHPVGREELSDDQTIAEQLVEQGLNAAEHEQMVEGAKASHHQ